MVRCSIWKLYTVMRDLGFLLSLLLITGLLLMASDADCAPHSRSDAAVKGMRQVPQWHCLRYRKFDFQLVRRCRNHRVTRRY